VVVFVVELLNGDVPERGTVLLFPPALLLMLPSTTSLLRSTSSSWFTKSRMESPLRSFCLLAAFSSSTGAAIDAALGFCCAKVEVVCGAFGSSVEDVSDTTSCRVEAAAVAAVSSCASSCNGLVVAVASASTERASLCCSSSSRCPLIVVAVCFVEFTLALTAQKDSSQGGFFSSILNVRVSFGMKKIFFPLNQRFFSAIFWSKCFRALCTVQRRVFNCSRYSGK